MSFCVCFCHYVVLIFILECDIRKFVDCTYTQKFTALPVSESEDLGSCRRANVLCRHSNRHTTPRLALDIYDPAVFLRHNTVVGR